MVSDCTGIVCCGAKRYIHVYVCYDIVFGGDHYWSPERPEGVSRFGPVFEHQFASF